MTSLAPSMARPPTGSFDESRRTAPHVTIRGLSKHYPDAVIYDRFDFDIPRGKLISVFGPNGCGKSTLINMIAGLVPADAGEVLFDGRPLSRVKFGYVFQNYREALFPWLPAFDNIAYPLKVMGVPKAEREQRVERSVRTKGAGQPAPFALPETRAVMARRVGSRGRGRSPARRRRFGPAPGRSSLRTC